MRLIKFYTTWCNPCKILTPILNKVCGELGVDLVEVNAEEDSKTVEHFNVAGVPTIILVDEDYEEIRRHMGIITEKHLVEWISMGEWK